VTGLRSDRCLHAEVYCPAGCPVAASDAQYELVGVVVHQGSMRGGHYVAYVRRSAAEEQQQEHVQQQEQQQQQEHEQQEDAGGGASKEAVQCMGTAVACEGQQNGVHAGQQQVKQQQGQQQQAQHLWYYISDTQVRQVQVSEVLGCQAYITMYVRSGGSSSSSSRLQQGMRGGRGGI
jgi:ubiquitin C-terminal hydrolase